MDRGTACSPYLHHDRINTAFPVPPFELPDYRSLRPSMVTNQDRNVRDACVIVPSITPCDIPQQQTPATTPAP
ncbi:hypothetical protein [Candidatus Cryosericum terrychapinii]|uniref:hypothetical protein n=1 Tax=Candidatus Cryosericum terrychapinii TaxID=2290919 RepID=UPI000F892F2B|nr:hypothetical protein [Candidatus Cryosericum terrychapinii]